MMPHDIFAAILRALARHGIHEGEAIAMAHAIMDEFEAAS